MAGPDTEAIMQTWEARASSTGATKPYQLAIVESCIAFYERALRASTLTSDQPIAFHPNFLAMTARSLLTNGECVYAIEVINGMVHAYPAQSWSVYGNTAIEDDWFYEIDVATPSYTRRFELPGAGVLHPRIGTTIAEPWRGVPPLARPRLTAQLAADIEMALDLEARIPVGHIIPVPDGARDNEWWKQFEEDVKNLRGSVAFPETTSTGAGFGEAAAPRRDWQPIEMRPAFDQGIVQARESAAVGIATVFGVPPILLSNRGDGQANREAWRVFVAGAVNPLAKVISEEILAKVGPNAISTADLSATDIQGRARAYRSLIDAGMTAEEAKMYVSF